MKSRPIGVLTILALCLSVTAIPASAAVKAGAKCKIVGQMKIKKQKEFICITKGKKLVWVRDNAIPSPSPSVASEIIAAPSNFSDLYEKREGISTSAWMKVNSKLSSNVQLPPIEVYRGPNTPIYVKDPSEYFKFVAQVFSGKALPKKIVVFYWNNQDMSIVSAKALSVMGTENDQLHTAITGGPFVDCYTPTNCDVGHAFIGVDGNAYLGAGIPDTLAQVIYAPGIGGVEVIEFYHSLNLLPYHLNSLSVIAQKQNIKSPNLPPFWMNQGGEGLMSLLFASKNNLNGFTRMTGRKWWVDQKIPNFGPEWINNYLNIANLGNNWSDSSGATSKPHQIMGNYLVEIFVALKGPSVMLDFHEQMAQKKSFDIIFQDIFGTTWNDAKPELVKVIYDRYLYNY
jgi:hypothetical protein